MAKRIEFEPRRTKTDSELQKIYLKKLREAAPPEVYDLEICHGEYDDILCELLVELGFHEIVRQFESTDKWYA